MSRFLLVVPPLAGHVNPLLAVAHELRHRGHQTAWAGAPEVLSRLIGPDGSGASGASRGAEGSEARIYPVGGSVPTGESADRPGELRGFGALQHLWEEFLVPLAQAGVDDVETAVSDFDADVVVADQQALAGPLAALRTGRPWVTSASSSAEFSAPLEATPKVAKWRRDVLDDLVRRLAPGAVADTVPDPYLSTLLALVFSTPLLVGANAPVPAQVRFVGSVRGGRPTIDFPWSRLRPDRRLVYVTLGTVNSSAAARFLAECVAAARLIDGPVQFVIADPGGALSGPAVADDVIVAAQVPQLDLLARASAVICHGGHNTVCEALSHGVPLVVAPIRDDQPVIAQQVIDAGAGIRIRFGRATAAHLATAVTSLLGDPQYAERARLVQASLAAAGGAPRAAQLLEQAARGVPLRPEVGSSAVVDLGLGVGLDAL